MKNILLGLLLVLSSLLFLSCQPRQERDIKLLQFNIWHEGTKVKDGFDAVADEIVRSDADFITLSEVRNYGDTRFCDRIVEALKARGKTYYSVYSQDSGIVSRYPIKESDTVYPLSNDEGTMYRILADMDGQEVAVYTGHLDYRHCASYLPRGYDGSSWSKLPAPVTDVAAVQENNRASKRDDAIRNFLEMASRDRKAGRIVLFGGDFNEPSHRDWTEQTKDLWDHRGVVIPWDCTVMLEKAGYVDAYREKYPDPVTHPGFTFPADCPHVGIKELAWTPDVDDRERIDYVFYGPHQGLTLKDIVIVGPKGTICRGQRVQDTPDPVVTPLGIWPTDHKAVLATFHLVK